MAFLGIEEYYFSHICTYITWLVVPKLGLFIYKRNTFEMGYDKINSF